MTVSSRRLIEIPSQQDGVFPAQCPSRTLLDHVTSKWGVLVLLALGVDVMRWSELRRRIEGISEKMLAQTLQALERDGMVLRDVQATIPPRVEYSLTPLGHAVATKLLELIELVETEMPAVLAARARFDAPT